ncbi:MAG: thiamine biosynthesis protein ThiS [Rhodospirillales bacterium]|jgi:sulfur carrier protein|nr:thiamine biosynthesis protein ThiS [Rhodospirillales bacterium]
MRINGKDWLLAEQSLGELLAAQGIDPATRYLAVAINGTVVPRGQWSACRLAPDDDIEIVRPREGG